MEKWQEEHIVENLPELMKDIDCNANLLSYLRKFRVLSAPDIDKLKTLGKAEGNNEKNDALLKILMTRKKGYEYLAKALFKNRQTGALLTMLHGYTTNIPGARSFDLCGIELNVDEILTKDVLFAGKIFPLKEVCTDIKPKCLKELINASLDTTSYGDILSEKPLHLTADTIPKSIPFYIPRTLFINTQLDPKIFDTLETDIFCIEGIEIFHLTALSNRQDGCITDKSRNQTDDVTARFILLEHHDHFQEIAANTDQSVHWIKLKNNNFYYVKCSTGSGIRTIQEYLIPTNSEHISETEFLSRSQEGPRNATILLYDSPGMGKSVLLARLAHKTKENHPNRSVVFLQVSELMAKLRQVQQEPSSEGIKLALVEAITTNTFGQNITKALMNSKNHQIEVFLDAFDEVPEYDQGWAKRILNVIAKECRNIRMYITTRRHKRDELEEKFGMLGYNILPFDNSNKLSFFQNYWQSKYGIEINDERKEFAEHCLKTVSSELSVDDTDIAGIPLQCRMLADIYAKDAKRGAPFPTESQLQLKSIFQVYKCFIDTKFSTFCTDAERQVFYDFHVRESLRTLFPEKGKHFHEDLCVPNEEMIYRIGILEPLKSDSGEFVFSHRTLAECFAAEFLATAVNSSLVITSDFINLFFQQALMYAPDRRSENLYFLNPVLCRFLNFFLSTSNSDVRVVGALKNTLRESEYYQSQTLIELLESCLVINAVHLFLFLLDIYLDLDESVDKPTILLRFKQDLQHTQTWEMEEVKKRELVHGLKEDRKLKRLVYIAVQHSSLNLVKLSYKFVESVTGKKVNEFLSGEYTSPISVALERGHFQIFEYLLSFDREGFYKLQLPLLHPCLHYSYGKSVGDKVQIVKMFLHERPHLLHKRHPDSECVPLLALGAHFSLVKCLVEAGADLTQTNKAKQNICHLTAEYFSEDEYHELVQLIVSHNASTLLKQRDKYELTPVHTALRRIDLKSETLELLANKCNVTFNDNSNENRESELEIAIWNGRSSRVIKDIIRLGGDKYHLDLFTRQKLARDYKIDSFLTVQCVIH